MKKTIRLISVLLCCVLLTACNSHTPSPIDERLMSEIRSQYRGSALVIEGAGVGQHIDSTGNTCYDITISDIYAGSVDEKSIIHLKGNEVDEGERYLLFLGEGEDVHYAEDTVGYTLLSGEPLHIHNDEVVLDGKRLPIGMLKDEITDLSSVISAPAPVLYYDSISALADASDEIFIGRVTKLPELSKKTFSIRNCGNIEKAQYDTAIVTVEVFNSIKSGLSSTGETIELIYSPERVNSMLDAATLQSRGLRYNGTPELKENDICLFFLKSGPDSKQPYYFLINPVQGFVRTSDDTLFPCADNTPLLSFDSLAEVVGELHRATSFLLPADDDAPLLIVEEE